MYIVETMKKPESKIPTYDLLLPKFESLVCAAKWLQPFLTKYQSDWPMIPFLAKDLEVVLHGLMTIFIKASVLQEEASTKKLLDVDVTISLKQSRQVDFGFGTTNALQSILRVKLTEAKKLEFFYPIPRYTLC